MPDRLALIVPTRGRPENIRRLIGAWDFTNAWDVADLILAVDADDPEIGGYREVAAETDHPDTEEQLVSLVVSDVWVPMVHKLDRVSVAAAESRLYFAIGFAGDDHVPQTIGWAQRYLTVLRELGTGMVYGDDGYQGVKLSTEWAVTADAVRALGRMVPAPVEHMYCDNSMMDVFGGAGAMRHLPEIRIEHMHPVAGKAASDEQYQRVNHRDQFRRDRTAYERWKTTEMNDQINAVTRLRGWDVPPVPLPVQRKEKLMSTPSTRRRAVQRSGPSSQRASMNRFPFTAEFKHVRGATPDEIGVTLADYAKNVPADQEIVELGVFQGRTALIMAWGARQGHGAHVTAIDPWDLPGNVYDPPFTEADSRRWAQYRINELGYQDDITLVQDFSHDYAARWEISAEAEGRDGRRVGLLYVDGDHTKEGARRDIESWAPHLAPGAVIAVDDYGHPDWPGVGEAVDELVSEGFLAPIKVFYDRLAVTRLALPPATSVTDPSNPLHSMVNPTAITSEGVSPEPDTAAAELLDEVPATEVQDLESLPLGTLRARVKARGTNPKGLSRAELIAALR